MCLADLLRLLRKDLSLPRGPHATPGEFAGYAFNNW